MSGTKMIRCSCNNDYQDKLYGSGKRVGNLTDKGDEAACTSCGKKVKV